MTCNDDQTMVLTNNNSFNLQNFSSQLLEQEQPMQLCNQMNRLL